MKDTNKLSQIKNGIRNRSGEIILMMTEDRFKETAYKMSYEEYKKCHCPECKRENCIHRDAYRRLPEIDGGLNLCPNLKE